LVTAAEQTAGRGRQGRSWVAPAGSALLCSLVLRRPPRLLSLVAGVAVCDAVEHGARLKWPNDIVVGADLAKLAGILVEARPQENWAVLGIGVNVAVRRDDLPAELREHAASLELPPSAIEPTLQRLIESLQRRLAEPAETLLEAWREHDALLGRAVVWAGGEGSAHGIDDAGRLLVRLASGAITTLDAGEVHLGRV
jgi:BirA family biotin operon repressor/biotin-[acetyl-CoA-carboxylase] ligase